MVYTMTSERMCVLACAAGIACAVPNTARGIPVSGPPVQYEQSYCVKVRVCGGYANGQCKAMGVVCKSGSCEPDGARPDYCSWTYVFDCEGPALTTCVLIVLSEIGTDCGMGCRWISYNLCACECQDLGTGIESSDYAQCQTVAPPVGP